jgi:hypothetical protein
MLSPDECRQYAIAILRKKFDISDNQIETNKKMRINKMNKTDTNKRLICTVNI